MYNNFYTENLHNLSPNEARKYLLRNSGDSLKFMNPANLSQVHYNIAVKKTPYVLRIIPDKYRNPKMIKFAVASSAFNLVHLKDKKLVTKSLIKIAVKSKRIDGMTQCLNNKQATKFINLLFPLILRRPIELIFLRGKNYKKLSDQLSQWVKSELKTVNSLCCNTIDVIVSYLDQPWMWFNTN